MSEFKFAIPLITTPAVMTLPLPDGCGVNTKLNDIEWCELTGGENAEYWIDHDFVPTEREHIVRFKIKLKEPNGIEGAMVEIYVDRDLKTYSVQLGLFDRPLREKINAINLTFAFAAE